MQCLHLVNGGINSREITTASFVIDSTIDYKHYVPDTALFTELWDQCLAAI